MSPLVRKLRHGARFTEDDLITLVKLGEPARRVDRGELVSEETGPRSIVLLLDGWAYEYKQLANGKRQITAVFVPGDLCGSFGAVPPAMDQSLAAFTPVLLARVTPHDLREAARASPCIEDALWWDLLFTKALQREHLVSLGRRSATERLAYFFCEINLRLKLVGLVDELSCDMPLTQADLADVFGLSVVHVNRSLQELRGAGLISLRGRRLTIHDADGLCELAMFDPDPALLRWGPSDSDAGTDRRQLAMMQEQR